MVVARLHHRRRVEPVLQRRHRPVLHVHRVTAGVLPVGVLGHDGCMRGKRRDLKLLQAILEAVHTILGILGIMDGRTVVLFGEKKEQPFGRMLM